MAMVHGPDRALAGLEGLDAELGDHHHLAAVRGHLLEMAGRSATTASGVQRRDEHDSRPERIELLRRAARLAARPDVRCVTGARRQFTPSRSTTNTSVSPPRITPPAPRLP